MVLRLGLYVLGSCLSSAVGENVLYEGLLADLWIVNDLSEYLEVDLFF